jgi:cellulose synthase/poly-beta-1,6-N-acetylglucosamine synthase-like glycosyltransferase
LIAIELGRSFTSIFNILLVISGAFGVFRREIFSGTGKFDKDTITEDFDLTLKVRKTKGKIPFVKDSIARTYCPNNWKAWIKQRQRWAHGQMQTLKKHRDLMLSSKSTNRDRIAMFDMWVLDIVMNFLFVVYLIALGPASIIMAVYGNVHILVNVLTLVVITYLVSETLIFVFAVLVSRKYKYFKYLYLVPFMALFYRPFLKIVIFKSYINAARNKEATW